MASLNSHRLMAGFRGVLCGFLFPQRRCRIGLAIIHLAAILLVAASCGKVGPPLPPEILIPTAVNDLTGAQIGNEIKLAWTLPVQNTNGSKATTIQRMVIYRQILPLTAPLPSAEELAVKFHGTKVLTIDTANLAAFTDRGKVVFYDKFPGLDAATLPHNRFAYAVKVLNKKRQDAGLSNIVLRQFLPVPPPVTHLNIRAEETALILTWDALPPPGGSNVEIAGYNLYRSEQSKVYPPAPLNEAPIATSRYEDHNFHFGKTYYYTLRAVVRHNTLIAESFDSPESSFKPVDVFPPKAPAGLTVVFAGGKMNLSWDANLEPDFAGYQVYRSDDGVNFQKLNAELLKSPTFRDEKVQPGKKYFYRVTALDTSGNVSPPSEIVWGITEGPRS